MTYLGSGQQGVENIPNAVLSMDVIFFASAGYTLHLYDSITGRSGDISISEAATSGAEPPGSEPQAGNFQMVARQASIRFFGLGFDKVLGYAFALFVTKTYGSTDFGLYLFGVGVIEVLLSFTKLGFDRSAVRSIATLNATGRLAEIKGVVRASALFTMPLAIATATALFAFSATLPNLLGRPGLGPFLRVASLAIPASILADVLLWTTEGIGRQRYFVTVRTICEPAMKTTLAIVFFLVLGRSDGVRLLGLAYTISTLCSAILAFAVYKRVVVARSPGRPVESHAGELLRVGLPFWGQVIAGRVLGQADIFLIFTMVSAAATANYTVATRTAMLPIMIAFAFDAALRPVVAHTLAKGSGLELSSLFRSVSRSVLMLCLPAYIVLILFPGRVMSVVGGQFGDSGSVARVIGIGALVSFVLGPAASVLMMAGHSRIPFVNGLLSGLVSLVISIALIPRLGVVGAAVAQASSLILSSALNAAAARRRLGVFAIGRRHAPLFFAAVLTTGAALLAGSVVPANKYAALLVIGVPTVLVYAATLLLLGVTAEDKQLFRGILMLRPRKGSEQ